MRIDFGTVQDLQELVWYSAFFTDVEYNPVSSLFHYTNEQNRNHIIKTDHVDLRLTRADQFVDHDEGRHIIIVFRHAVSECLAAKKIDRIFHDTLLSAITEHLDFIMFLQKYYVFCFTKNNNSEYMKQNYACKNNGNGIIIGLQALDIEYLTDIRVQNSFPISLNEVLYDIQRLSEYMQQLICRMFELRNQDNELYSLCKRIAINQLATYSLSFKAPAYRFEEETRLIVKYDDFDQHHPQIEADEDEKYIHIKLPLTAIYTTSEVIPCKQTSPS